MSGEDRVRYSIASAGLNKQTAAQTVVQALPVHRIAELAGLGLTGVMAASWVGAVTYLSQLPFFHWRAPLLVPVAMLTFLGAYYFAKRRDHLGSARETWLVGLIAPSIIHRLVGEIVEVGFDGFANSLALWIADPGLILTPSLFFNSTLLVATWTWTVVTATGLRGLEIQEGEIPEEDQSPSAFEDLGTFRSTDRIAHFERLRNSWVTGVVVLAVLVGFLYIIGSPLGQEMLATDTEMGVPVRETMLYILAGFVLISVNQLVRMTSNWEVERTMIPSSLPTRWLGSSLGLIGFALVLALLMPTGYGQLILALLKLLEPIILFLIGIGILIGYLLISIISLPFSLIPGGEGEIDGTPSPVITPSASDPTSDSALLHTLAAIAGWVLIVLALYFIARYFWRRRHTLRFVSVVTDLLNLVRLAIYGLIALLRGVMDFGSEAARFTINRIMRKEVSAPPVWRPAIRLRDLDERGWLEYMIFSIFSRAQKLGHDRAPSTTVAEYADRLRRDLPVVDPQLSRIVDRFHQSRYGEAPISRAQVDEAKGWWNHLKRRLQQAYRARQGRGETDSAQR